MGELQQMGQPAEPQKDGGLLALVQDFKERKKRPLKDAKMDMTPMIDIVFMLIIFFIIVSELSKAELEQVTLPFAEKAQKDEQDNPNRLIINVTGGDDSGTLIVNKRVYSPPELAELISRAAQTNPTGADGLPSLKIKIRGDRDVEWKHIQNVMMACMRASVWQLSFGATPRDLQG
jgi:biopolymer transport protein ExbD